MRCPACPHPGPLIGSEHAQTLGLLVWEAYPVATSPRPSPAAATATPAAPSPLAPKVAVCVGQCAKGFSVLLALFLEWRAAAAGCRAVRFSMPNCSDKLPEECDAT